MEINISGGINNFRNIDPIIYGYLAEIGNNNPRTAILKIDEDTFEIICDHFRLDLKKNGINKGFHALEFIVPINFIDGNKHQLQLFDKETGKLISTEELVWSKDSPNLKSKALKGKDGFLFLTNDTNNEIKQHFDESYENKFNAEIFSRYFDLNKKFCDEKGIRYYFFIIPDKSVVCNNFLPFEVKIIKRNYDLVDDLFPDFAKNLNFTSYFKADTHINHLGGKELSYCYLNHIDKNFKREDFNRLINEQIFITYDYTFTGDLTKHLNSYSDEEKADYLDEKYVVIGNKYLIDLNEDLPEEFKIVNTRETEYCKNEEGLTDLRVLIFRDSSFGLLKNVLGIYFKEMLLYWDHWDFNKDLIEWYKPDIILEVRTERFLENMNWAPG